jgi:hypothetical protein
MTTFISTYTAPPVPLTDFDDYRPRRGLDSIVQAAASIAATYDVDVTWSVTTDGVKFTVDGPQANVDDFSALYQR